MEISINELMHMVSASAKPAHPYNGRRVLAVMPHGFIHFGTLHDEGGRLRLTGASNLRYWSKRDGGLPEFAARGPKSEDRIDAVGEISLESPLFFYPLGEWNV